MMFMVKYTDGSNFEMQKRWIKGQIDRWKMDRPISMWLLLYSHNYGDSVKLVFRWCSMTFVLSFSCNFYVVLGGGEHNVYLLHHLDPLLFLLQYLRICRERLREETQLQMLPQFLFYVDLAPYIKCT